MDRPTNKYMNSPGETPGEAPVWKQRTPVPATANPMYENTPAFVMQPVAGQSNAQYDLIVEEMSPVDPKSEKGKLELVNEKNLKGDHAVHFDKTEESPEALKFVEDLNDPGLGWEMNYKLEDIPSWFDTLVLGFQVYLMMAGTTVSLPFVLSRAMCMQDKDPDRANIVSTFIFVSGIITILQSSFGTRLPIVQGGSSAFMIPSLAILASREWECPSKEDISAKTDPERTELWQVRMREICGAIIVASLFQVLFGFFGVIGLILRFITPLTIAPSITMIGLSLFSIAGGPASSNWLIALGTIFIIIIFSQYLRTVKVPIPLTNSPKRPGWKRYQMFKNLPILFGMAVMWILCAILTVSGGLGEKDAGRTDLNYEVIEKAEWFRVPYPFQWGIPTVSLGAVMGILAGVIAGIIESIGDYYACARIIGTRAPPVHAINRGIFIEGIGCIIAGIWGTGNGTTSYSENIGAIGVTQVGSRRVIQVGGLLMIVFSLFSKLNAVFVSIPEPIVGAFLIVVFAIVTAVGLSNLKGVNLNSPRNIFIIGFSIFFSLTVSQWMKANPNSIQLGNKNLNQMIKTFLSAGMFLGGFFGFVLDNTIPGTREERGLDEWEKQFAVPKSQNDLEVKVADPYDMPFIMNFLHNSKLSEWFPISPTFQAKKYQELIGKLFICPWRRQRQD